MKRRIEKHSLGSVSLFSLIPLFLVILIAGLFIMAIKLWLPLHYVIAFLFLLVGLVIHFLRNRSEGAPVLLHSRGLEVILDVFVILSYLVFSAELLVGLGHSIGEVWPMAFTIFIVIAASLWWALEVPMPFLIILGIAYLIASPFIHGLDGYDVLIFYAMLIIPGLSLILFHSLAMRIEILAEQITSLVGLFLWIAFLLGSVGLIGSFMSPIYLGIGNERAWIPLVISTGLIVVSCLVLIFIHPKADRDWNIYIEMQLNKKVR